jgi:zinc protease
MMRAIAIALVACTATPKPKSAPEQPAPATEAIPWDRSGVDWSAPPPVGEPSPFAAPAIESFTLANGIRVLVVERHHIPLVSLVSLHVAAGSRDDGAKGGLAALAVDVLADGATADAERIGTKLETAITSDYATLAMSVAADHLTEGVATLAAAVRTPSFSDADVARVRAERVAEIAERTGQPQTIAGQLFDAVVFGSHPYAHASAGRASTVSAITPAELRAFHKRAYTPATTTLIAVGEVRRVTLEPLLAKAFGEWAAPPSEPPRTPPVAGPSTPELAYVDRPGATKAQVMIGRRAYAAGDSRQLAADVENAILGSTEHESRLRKLAATVGVAPNLVGSSLWRGQWGGTWSIAALVDTANTVAVVREIRTLIDAARTADPSQAEVDRAKRELLRRLPMAFETNASTARAIVRLVAHSEPLDFYATYATRLAAVTPAAARAALAPLMTDLTIVVVGDWKEIGPGLTALGLPVHRYPAPP